MKKKIAIAVDPSMSSAQAVRYAAAMDPNLKDAAFVLLHIQPAISQYLLDEAQTSAKVNAELKKLVEKNRSAGLALLEKYRQQMVAQGIDGARIETKTTPRTAGVADDLLLMAQTASYDALLVGRRGVSYLHGLIMGSVTANLVNNSQLTPIWVVDGEVSAQPILLAVDGSPSSLRALDHLCFMLRGSDRARVNMVHVQPRLQDYCEIDLSVDPAPEAQDALLQSDKKCIDNFHAQALSILDKNGLSRESFNLKVLSNKMVTANAVLEEARGGGYGTVVVGRRGQSKSSFFGSVSRGILQKAQNMAVWVVP